MNGLPTGLILQQSDYSDLVAAIFGAFLYIIGTFFMLRMLINIFVGQIDLASGRPGALADILVQSTYTLLCLILAVNAKAINAAITNVLVADIQALTTTNPQNIVVVLEPFAKIALGIITTLVISFTFISVVFSAVKGQISVLSGSVAGLSGSVIQGLIAVATFGIGVIVIVLGSKLIQNSF